MIKERIIKVIELKGIPKEIFFKKIGMTSANFRGDAKKTPLNSTAIENILSEIPDLNPRWLLTGEGDMLNGQAGDNVLVCEKATSYENSREGIPLITLDAFASIAKGEIRVMDYECDRYIIPGCDDADFLIAVKGPSMSPKYASGDIVACRHVPLENIFFQWNKVYVLDTAQGALIKRVKKGSDKQHILLISDNEEYEPFELSLDQINAVALVMGIVRLE